MNKQYKVALIGDSRSGKSSLVRSLKGVEFLYETQETIGIDYYQRNVVNLDQDNCIQCFDFDKINDNILIRKRIDGDKIVPLGMKGTKKLKDIFIDMKIPKEDRERVPILCFDEKIAWIIGIKISEDFKVTNTSKKILKVVVKRKEH